MKAAILEMIARLSRRLAGPGDSQQTGEADLLSRFARERDEAAFTAILDRHGRLVWGVCRSLLYNDADAEDAFQATWVALFRGAAQIRRAGSLPAWLHNTASRIAKKIRLAGARRSRREQRAAKPESAPAVASDQTWDALHAAVHDEIANLPKILRAAFVLCVLEGQRHEDAAAELAVPVGTLSARVSRARKILLDRLSRRGLAPAVAAATVASSTANVPAAVPEPMLLVVRRHLADGFASVSKRISHLANSVAGGVWMKVRWLLVAVFLAALTLTGWGMWFANGQGTADKKEKQDDNVPLKPAVQQPAKTDKEKLKGDWVLVSNESHGIIAEIFGQVPEPNKVKIATIADDQMKLKANGNSKPVGSFHLEPTKMPKTLDLTIPVGKTNKATLQGIYELDGNNLKMCFDSFGEERPDKFPVKRNDPERPFGKWSVIAFRRVGADPKEDALERNKAKAADNLATLALIMHDYVSETRAYPPAAIYSKDGKPLLSWRVALLEHMDEGDLLKEFRTDEPWDSPHNKKLIKKMPKIYALPGAETNEPGMTYFQVFTGKGTVFEGKTGLKLTDQLKGQGPNFMIVEAGEPVIWTKPDDVAYDLQKPLPKLGRVSSDGFFAAMTFPGDRIRFISKSTPEKKLRALIQGGGRGEK